MVDRNKQSRLLKHNLRRKEASTDNLCFYFQNRLIQTSQTGGQWYSDTSHLVFPGHIDNDIPVTCSVDP